MIPKHIHRLVGCGLVLLLALAPVAQGLSRDTVPLARGEIIRDYARITFEWPKTVYFTAQAKGKVLTLTFDRKADPEFGPMLAQLAPYVVRAERKGDGKTIVLTFNKPYKIRTFVSDDINGVDLLGIDPAARDALLAQMDSSGQPEPLIVAASEESASALSALAPAAGADASAPTVAAAPEVKTPAPAEVPAPAVEPKPAPVAEVAPKAESAVPQVKAQAPAEVPAPAVEPKPAPQAATTAPVAQTKPAEAKPEVPMAPGDGAPASVAEAKAAVPANQLKVNVSASEDSAVLRFPLTERTALAAFVRAHALWVVINKSKSVDLSDFEGLPRTVIGKAIVVPAKNATVIYMPIDEGINVATAKENSDFSWAVLLTVAKRPLINELKVDVNTDPPSPPHVFIPTLEMAEPVIVTDPAIGDQMVITPLFNPGEGVARPRDFIEFALMATAQGIAVAKKADDVMVVQLRNGMRISTVGGAMLTPGLPEPKIDPTAANLQNIVTLFPYELWKADDPEKVKKQVQGLFRRIVESDNPQEANEARLRLAQLYLSDGRAAEALGMIDGINRTNPAFYRSVKIAALRGAAHFLMYRFVDASRDFSAAELNNNKEVDYWRSMISDLLGNPDQNYDYIKLNPDYISKYPPVFRQRLAIVAADRSISAKEYNTALKIFDTLNEDKLLDPISNYINFLIAKTQSDTGQEKESMEMLDKLANDFDHPFVQSRAEFSRIVWGLEHGTLDKEKAADRLERLRLAWHGDGLELQVLTMLGDIYFEKKDYINAMRIWHGGVTSFPNTSVAIEMSRRMQEVFITMFNEGIADNLPTLNALALYYEYRNYTPPGSTGQAMIERLADRLVSVDLLEQASALLDHQMRFQMEKEQRSRIGAKLATVYLLNHQPARALQALQDSVFGENPLMLRLYRNRLTAQAMAEMGEADKALVTLGQDATPDAERIRLEIYWKEKDWERVISSVEATLKVRENITAPITLDESESLLKLALAYVFKNNKQQLSYMRDYFGPLMENNPNKPVFDFITGNDVPLTTTNFDDVIKNLSQTRSFIENYRAQIKTAGLDTAVKP